MAEFHRPPALAAAQRFPAALVGQRRLKIIPEILWAIRPEHVRALFPTNQHQRAEHERARRVGARADDRYLEPIQPQRAGWADDNWRRFAAPILLQHSLGDLARAKAFQLNLHEPAVHHWLRGLEALLGGCEPFLFLAAVPDRDDNRRANGCFD